VNARRIGGRDRDYVWALSIPARVASRRGNQLRHGTRIRAATDRLAATLKLNNQYHVDLDVAENRLKREAARQSMNVGEIVKEENT
jgi:hypothetical protein